MAHIGIDLGTSNTLVALVNASGKPELKEIDGFRRIPSMVYIDTRGGKPEAGRVARDYWADPDFDPARCFRRWKLRIGENHEICRLALDEPGADPISVTPEFLTTQMVEHVLSQLSAGLGGETIDSVLVTVPHGWRREQPEKCRATRLAAGNARLSGKPAHVQDVTVSEPVAAAAYWIWQARQGKGAADLEGKTVLVCDVGGGTFDLSLITVGAPSEPLVVVDAANNAVAGDFADALLVAWACRVFNQQHGTSYPTTAEGVLDALNAPDLAWLRGWFLKAQDEKERFSSRSAAAAARGEQPKVTSWTLTDPQFRTTQLKLDSNSVAECFEPLYTAGKALLKDFLVRHRSTWPHAVVFAGGGSHICGIRSHTVAPILEELFGHDMAAAVLNCLPVNLGKMDEAIALGAALIASGVVTVRERLLYSVGLRASIAENVARELGLEAKMQYVIVTPVISVGTELPATVRSTDLGLRTFIDPGSLWLDLVVDDASDDPWVQTFIGPEIVDGRRSVDWEVCADTDGAITVRLSASGARPGAEAVFRQQRTRERFTTIMFGGPEGQNHSGLARITPEDLANAQRALSENARGGRG